MSPFSSRSDVIRKKAPRDDGLVEPLLGGPADAIFKLDFLLFRMPDVPLMDAAKRDGTPLLLLDGGSDRNGADPRRVVLL